MTLDMPETPEFVDCSGCRKPLAERENTNWCSSRCSCLGAVWCHECWNKHIDRLELVRGRKQLVLLARELLNLANAPVNKVIAGEIDETMKQARENALALTRRESNTLSREADISRKTEIANGEAHSPVAPSREGPRVGAEPNGYTADPANGTAPSNQSSNCEQGSQHAQGGTASQVPRLPDFVERWRNHVKEKPDWRIDDLYGNSDAADDAQRCLQWLTSEILDMLIVEPMTTSNDRVREAIALVQQLDREQLEGVAEYLEEDAKFMAAEHLPDKCGDCSTASAAVATLCRVLLELDRVRAENDRLRAERKLRQRSTHGQMRAERDAAQAEAERLRADPLTKAFDANLPNYVAEVEAERDALRDAVRAAKDELQHLERLVTGDTEGTAEWIRQIQVTANRVLALLDNTEASE